MRPSPGTYPARRPGYRHRLRCTATCHDCHGPEQRAGDHARILVARRAATAWADTARPGTARPGTARFRAIRRHAARIHAARPGPTAPVLLPSGTGLPLIWPPCVRATLCPPIVSRAG